MKRRTQNKSITIDRWAMKFWRMALHYNEHLIKKLHVLSRWRIAVHFRNAVIQRVTLGDLSNTPNKLHSCTSAPKEPPFPHQSPDGKKHEAHFNVAMRIISLLFCLSRLSSSDRLGFVRTCKWRNTRTSFSSEQSRAARGDDVCFLWTV